MLKRIIILLIILLSSIYSQDSVNNDKTTKNSLSFLIGDWVSVYPVNPLDTNNNKFEKLRFYFGTPVILIDKNFMTKYEKHEHDINMNRYILTKQSENSAYIHKSQQIFKLGFRINSYGYVEGYFNEDSLSTHPDTENEINQFGTLNKWVIETSGKTDTKYMKLELEVFNDTLTLNTIIYTKNNDGIDMMISNLRTYKRYNEK